MKPIPKVEGDHFCRTAKPAEKDVYLRDSQVPGLVLRITPAGVKTWQLRYSIKLGDKLVSRRKGLGRFPGITVAEARRSATEMKVDISRGADPVEDKRKIIEQRAAEIEARKLEAARRVTVADLYQDWYRQRIAVRHRDGGYRVSRMWSENILPAIGQIAVADVEPAHVLRITDTMTARGAGIYARRAFVSLRQFFTWAKPRIKGLTNPCADVPAKDVGTQWAIRDRVLYRDDRHGVRNELPELARKVPLAGLSEPQQIILWLQLATGARVGELCKARWSNVDLQAETWFIPAEHAKNGEAHTVFLSAFALRHFRRLHELTGYSEFCFPAAVRAREIAATYIATLVASRQTDTDKRLSLPGGKWTPHDLRRTAATVMQSCKVDVIVIEKCLNHKLSTALQQTYLHHSYREEMREAWRVLGERLELLTVENVVVMPAHRSTTAASR